MLITTKYDIGHKVVIDDVSIVGTVVQISLIGLNLIYKIEYWIDVKVCVADQDEWQLKEYVPKLKDMSVCSHT